MSATTLTAPSRLNIAGGDVRPSLGWVACSDGGR